MRVRPPPHRAPTPFARRRVRSRPLHALSILPLRQIHRGSPHLPQVIHVRTHLRQRRRRFPMNIERIKSALATGGEHLGDLLWWHLGDARIDRAQLESIWMKAGLDAALLPDAPTAEKALKVAAREAQVRQRERLIRLGKEDEHELVFAIV